MNHIPFSLLFPALSCDFAHVKNNNRQAGVAAETEKPDVLNLVQGARGMLEAGFKGQS